MYSRHWQKALSSSITTAKQLAESFPEKNLDLDGIGRVVRQYPLRINPYILAQLENENSSFWQQAVPCAAEVDMLDGQADPLAEDAFSPVANLTHRYPDRVLFLVSNQCAMYCRFCTRKRKVGKNFRVDAETIKEGIAYIRSNRRVSDVLVSGGDPLLLTAEALTDILEKLRGISHVETLRIGSRVPIVFPQRITEHLAKRLSRFQPLYLNIHVNHPDEITGEAAAACRTLRNAGISLGCQTVLLKGINDCPAVMKRLMKKLLKTGVRPYYLHQVDMARGVGHFRTSIKTGLDIIAALRGHISGMGIPHYVIDLPGGGGKVPFLPEAVVGRQKKDLLIRNYQGRVFKYRLDPEDQLFFQEEK